MSCSSESGVVESKISSKIELRSTAVRLRSSQNLTGKLESGK